MNIGERIYQYRTSKGLSQGDLAEMLNVSRQSISKWENNTAMPDLDKIVKLSEIFDISLDELVKGQMEQSDSTVLVNQVTSSDDKLDDKKGVELKKGRYISGIIQLYMATLIILCCFMMGSVAFGFLLATPFLVCGILCLVLQGSKNLGLWCSWEIYVLITIYLICATGISWNTIFMTLHWTSSMNYMRLAVAWALFIFLVALISTTVKRFSKTYFSSLKKGVYITVAYWCGYGAVYFSYQFIYKMLFNSIVVNGGVGNYGIITLYNIFFSLLKSLLFTLALIKTVRLVKTIKNQ